MSDYGEDDYSDGEEWFFIEDEYTPADDMAEHVVNSPPPTYADEEAIENWDRFDYFNDLEYASDGYDDGKFYTHKPQKAKTGQKRKRGLTGGTGKKKQRLEDGHNTAQADIPKLTLPPVLWRSQTDRELKPKLMEGEPEPYALLQDWRERLADTPAWATGSSYVGTPKSKASKSGKSKAPYVQEPMSPSLEDEVEESAEIDSSVLMAALQKNLASAGGPLSGMDPQQLLQFAMRMMTDQDAGDEIAGELADDMLNRDDEEEGVGEDEGEGPADLLSWLSKQRNPEHVGPTDPDAAPVVSVPKSLEAKQANGRPPTPPSSEANRSRRPKDDAMELDDVKTKNAAAFQKNSGSLETGHEAIARKRKAGEDADLENSKTASKKRATRPYEAPTAASHAKAAPTARATRSGRAKGS